MMTDSDFFNWLRQRVCIEDRGHATPCWLWSLHVNAKGYAHARVPTEGRNNHLIHRVVFERAVDPIPAGLHIDHLCRVRNCVNPDHLEPVSPAENVRRGVAGASTRARQASKTHCPHGHEYSPENTYSYKGKRDCRTCRKRRSLLRKASVVPSTTTVHEAGGESIPAGGATQ